MKWSPPVATLLVWAFAQLQLRKPCWHWFSWITYSGIGVRSGKPANLALKKLSFKEIFIYR